jgi:hypothetical protein
MFSGEIENFASPFTYGAFPDGLELAGTREIVNVTVQLGIYAGAQLVNARPAASGCAQPADANTPKPTTSTASTTKRRPTATKHPSKM